MGFLRSTPPTPASPPDAFAQALSVQCPEPVVLLSQEARLLAVNPAFCQWMQRDEAVLVGASLADFLAVEARDGFMARFDQILSQQLSATVPLRFIGEAVRDVELMPLPQGPVLALLRAVTQREPGQRSSVGTDLIQSQKMETIGRLAGGLAHSFNNTLMGIIGYCELALQDLPVGHPVRAHIDTVKQIGEKASGLTRQLLAYSRKQQLRIESVPLGAMVRGLEPVLRHWLGDLISLDIECEDTWQVQADSNQLEQVLMNLVINARDAMPSGGRLVIKTRDFRVDDALGQAFQGLKPGTYGMLMVCDTGSGMAPEVLENIFEPFFTTKERGRGTGLGLATVYGVVKQHGGYVGVASAEGVGTTFKIMLPADTTAHVANADMIRAPMLAGREFLFLTQDTSWTHYCAKLLRDVGAQVHIGWNALARMKRLHPGTGPYFDAIVSDELDEAHCQEQLVAAGLSESNVGRLICVTDLCALLSAEGCAQHCYLPKLLTREDTLNGLSVRLAGGSGRRL